MATPRGPDHDTSVVKLDASRAPVGASGEKYLASGIRISMRLWDTEAPNTEALARGTESARDYEVVGYVIAGRAQLHIEGQVVRLEQGNSWVVPRGARHFYHIIEPFTAVEATSPPAHVHGRDAPVIVQEEQQEELEEESEPERKEEEVGSTPPREERSAPSGPISEHEWRRADHDPKARTH